jgi:hypothetical protein
VNRNIVIILSAFVVILLVVVVFLAILLTKKKKQKSVKYEMKEPEIKFSNTDGQEDSYMNTFFIYDQENKDSDRTEAIGMQNNNIKVPKLSKEEKTEILFESQEPISPVRAHKDIKYAVIRYNQGNGDVFFNMKDPVVCLGRDPEICDIVLNFDRYAGRNHAVIMHKNNKLYLIDLNSKNGTYMDGAKVEGMVEIKEHSKIRVASTEIEVQP